MVEIIFFQLLNNDFFFFMFSPLQLLSYNF